MPGGGDPVGGGVRATDGGRGTLLPGAEGGTGAVRGLRGGDGGWIDGRAYDDTTWASGRGEMELDNLGHGGRCLVEECLGRVATRTAMHVHFLHLHVQDTVVILEEGNFPHPRCPRHNMLSPCKTLNRRHSATV